MPMERDTIEFAANASGDWFFHCHILYHMMIGMGRVFRYENSPPNPEIPDPALGYRKLKSDDRMFHFMANVGVQSNGSLGSDKAKALCGLSADLCEACAKECSKHQTEHCKECSLACKLCAEECRKMAA